MQARVARAPAQPAHAPTLQRPGHSLVFTLSHFGDILKQDPNDIESQQSVLLSFKEIVAKPTVILRMANEWVTFVEDYVSVPPRKM
jgi:hypothetical protein